MSTIVIGIVVIGLLVGGGIVTENDDMDNELFKRERENESYSNKNEIF